MAVGTHCLITLAELKAYMNLTVSTHDTLLEQLADRATGLFEEDTSRKLKARDYSYDSGSGDYDSDNAILDGCGFDEMNMPQYPVNSVTTLRINETEIDARSDIYGLGYVIRKKEGMIRLIGYLFTRGTANIELVYNAGFSTVPNVLKQACIEQAAWLFKQSAAGSALLGVSSKTLADGSVSYTVRDLLPQVRMVLERYKSSVAY